MIDVASVARTFDNGILSGVIEVELVVFSVREAITRYEELRPNYNPNGGQVETYLGMMSGQGSGPKMLDRVVQDRSWDKRAYTLVPHPVWDIVIAYDQALEQMFPNGAD